MKSSLSFSAALLAFLFSQSLDCHGAKIVWTNVNGGQWNVAANWSPNLVPGQGDDACITNDGVYTVELNVNGRVNTLLLGGDNGVQTLSGPARSLFLNSAGVVASNGVIQFGSVEGPGPLNIEGQGFWFSGGIAVGTTVTVGTGGTLHIAGSALKLIYGTLDNGGIVNWSGAGGISLYDGAARLNNLAGGIFNVQSNLNVSYLFTKGGNFNNAGILRKTDSAGTAAIDNGVIFHNTGTVDVQMGTLSIAGGGTLCGTHHVATNAAILFSGCCYGCEGTNSFTGEGVNRMVNGTFRFNNAITSENLELAGTASLAGTNTIHGAMFWTGGSIDPNGTVTVATNGTLNILGSAFKTILGTLNNAGAVNWAGSGTLFLNNAASRLNNFAGGIFNVQSNQTIDWSSSSGPSINNAGLFRKSDGAGSTLIDTGIFFHNSGVIDVQVGTLSITGGGTLCGTHHAAANATLLISGCCYGCDGTPAFTGAGATRLLNGTFRFNGAITSENLNLAGASLAGTNSVSGAMLWTAGAIDPNGRVTIANNGALNIDGAAFKTIHGALNNSGLINFAGSGGLYLNDASVRINNLAGGIFNVQSNQTIGWNSTRGGSIVNAGIFRKSDGAGTTLLDSIGFQNSGVTEALAGRLDFNGGYTQLAGVTRLNGGNIGSSSPLAVRGGKMVGYGSIFADVNISGELNPGNPYGILTITRSLTQNGSVNMDLSGLTPGTQHDRLNVTGTATLRGALNLCIEPGYRPNAGDIFDIVNFGSRVGQFSRINGLNLGGGKYLSPAYQPTRLLLTANNGPTNLHTMTVSYCGDGGFQVRFTGEPGHTYSIQASTHLTNDWTTLIAATNSPEGVIDYVDHDAPSYQRRFYRGVQTP